MSNDPIPSIPLPRATHTGKLEFGDATLDACVVPTPNGDVRLITQRTAISGLGIAKPKGSRENTAETHADYLVGYVAKIDESAFPVGGSNMPTLVPVRFIHPSNGKPAIGYRAADFTAICKFMLRARRTGLLTLAQSRVAEHAEVFAEALMEVAIVALIDEATGFQSLRGDNALQRELRAVVERIVSARATKWERRFRPAFFTELFRLLVASGRRRPEDFDASNPPRGFGDIINDLVYRRIAPGVLEELRRINPATAPGIRAVKHHQHIAAGDGVALLDKHIEDLITIAQGSYSWDDFIRVVNRRFPISGTQFSLPVEAA